MDTAMALARWAFFIAITVSFGSSLFPFYAGKGATVSGGKRAAIAAIVAPVAAIAWFAILTIGFGGTDVASFFDTAQTVLFETDFGPAWLFQFACLALLVIVALAWPRPALLLVLTAALLAGEAWIGHSAEGSTVERVSQIVHLLSAGAWLGGLPPLAKVLADGARGRTEEGAAARTVLRFSAMGMAAVTLIVLTGLANTVFVTGWNGDPFTFDLASDYDRILVAKVAIFLAMVGIAIVNRFFLTPRLGDLAGDRRAVLRWFGWTVLVEQGMGLAVLLLAAVLGMTSPPE